MKIKIYVAPTSSRFDSPFLYDIYLPENGRSPIEQVDDALMIASTPRKEWLSKDTLYIATMSDHFVNGVRLAAHDGLVDPKDVLITFLPYNPFGEDTDPVDIHVDANGSLSEYPDGFMDTWNRVLLDIMRTEDKPQNDK